MPYRTERRAQDIKPGELIQRAAHLRERVLHKRPAPDARYVELVVEDCESRAVHTHVVKRDYLMPMIERRSR